MAISPEDIKTGDIYLDPYGDIVTVVKPLDSNGEGQISWKSLVGSELSIVTLAYFRCCTRVDPERYFPPPCPPPPPPTLTRDDAYNTLYGSDYLEWVRKNRAMIESKTPMQDREEQIDNLINTIKSSKEI